MEIEYEFKKYAYSHSKKKLKEYKRNIKAV
jgi:hypothetical protein